MAAMAGAAGLAVCARVVQLPPPFGVVDMCSGSPEAPNGSASEVLIKLPNGSCGVS